nr:DUF2971 domain-containing protein [uncultured Albidiferax sp.]
MTNTRLPKRLYKFKTFDAKSLELVVNDLVFYANPADFNDPLDSKPNIKVDLAVDELKRALSLLMQRRLISEMSAAATAIKYKGPRTKLHIEELCRLQIDRRLEELSYLATDSDSAEQASERFKLLLGNAIENELLKRYERGILSLGERYACPLMWSHYGDQHRGICLGYSVPSHAAAELYQVRYGGSREVLASHVLKMLDGDVQARSAVDEAVLLRKAGDWRYEKEWRHLGLRGLQGSPFELEEVIFGIRCNAAVMHSVRKALDGRDREVLLYAMYETRGGFKLKREPLDNYDLTSSPRRSLSVLEEFSDIE